MAHFIESGDHTIRQQSSGRFLDAHESSSNNFSAVTRPAQGNDSQRWLHLFDEDEPIPPNVPGAPPQGFRRRWMQLSTRRYLDAHESGNDFSAVTRTKQNNSSQQWNSGVALGGATIPLSQHSSGRFLDAHESSSNNFSAVTRTSQNNNTQRWVVLPVAGSGLVTIQQLSTARFLDAHGSSSNDFSAVTRQAQGDDTQRWDVS